MKQLACSDMGVECNFVATAEDEAGVIEQAAAHGKAVHGYTDADFTPEMMEKVKAAVKDA